MHTTVFTWYFPYNPIGTKLKRLFLLWLLTEGFYFLAVLLPAACLRDALQITF